MTAINWLDISYGIFTILLGCSGFWAFLQVRMDRKDKKSDAENDEKKLLVGLAHDRIMFLGMNYVERGYITHDEFDNLNKYLYEPYERLGGNGSAKRVMEEVKKLPLYKPIYLVKEEKEKNDDPE